MLADFDRDESMVDQVKAAFKAADIQVQVKQDYDVDLDKVTSSLLIRNCGESELTDSGWRLYFSLGLTLAQGENLGTVRLIDGRHGFLEPSSGWPSLGNGEEIELNIETWLFAGMNLAATQGFYLSSIDADDKETILGNPTLLDPIIPDVPTLTNSWIKDTSPTCNTDLQTASSIYDRNEQIPAATGRSFLIPDAQSIDTTEDVLNLTNGFNISAEPMLANEKVHLSNLFQQFAAESSSGIPISLLLQSDLPDEGYHLTIDANGVKIAGSDQAGVYYGIQSLRQIISNNRLPCINIKDAPDWSHRALFLDISRHYQDADQIVKVIQIMAAYKMNRLQLGISNDEGWRLEIESVPELTDIGGRRQHETTNTSGEVQALYPAWGDDHQTVSGFLSQRDMIHILKTAASHHVEVILEFNLPGHANSIIQSLQNSIQYQVVDPDDQSVHQSAQGYKNNVVNVCLDSTYHFFTCVLSEIKDIYHRAGVPLKTIHLGGDEVPDGA